MRRLFAAVTLAALIAVVIPSPVAHAQEPTVAARQPVEDFKTIRFGTVPLATGIRMHFAERGDPSGEPIILLHGYSDSWFSFSRVMPLLSTRYHVVAVDLRGHGRSDQPESGYTMRELAADVLAFMDARGIQRATIAGHSMGSFVAQQVALAKPDRVSRLILIGSATGVGHLPNMVQLRDEVLGLPDPIPVDFIRAFQLSTIHVPVPSDFLEEVIRESRRLSRRVWRAGIEGMHATPVATKLAGVGAPALLIRGDRDSVFPRSELLALVALLSRSTVVEYPETGHAPHWERPERFVRDLETFLAASGKRVRESDGH